MLRILAILMFSSLAVHADTYDQQTAEATALIQSSAVSASYRYCVHGTLTCRVLVRLEDSTTHRPLPSFYDNFVSSERFVGSTGYFIDNCDGSFHNYLDQTFDGQVNIDTVFSENAKLTITYDAHGFPKIHGLIAKRLGTTRYAVTDLTYHRRKATIVGTEYDSADPNYHVPVNITYDLIH